MDISVNSELFHSFESNDGCSFVSADDDLNLHLGGLVENTFIRFTKNFNVCHINAQSIPAHYSELLATFENAPVHACLVSETFLKPTLPSSSFALPGYVLVRNDRTGKGGGGVAIYIRADIKYKVVSQSPSSYSKALEYLLLDISLNTVPVLLGVAYAPPTVTFIDKLEEILETFVPAYEHVLLMGDFNTCLIRERDRVRSTKLRTVTTSAGISMLKLDPTFHINDTHSELDLIMVSKPEQVAHHGQLAAPGFSHHDLIFVSYKVRTPKSKPKIVLLRSFARMDTEKLIDDARRLDWAELEGAGTVDSKLGIFNSTLLKLYDKHAPVRKVRVKRPPAPWLSDRIRMLMARRDRLRRKHRKNPTEENWCAFKLARNRCNQVIRNAKRRHIFEGINNCSPNKLWRFLRSLGVGKCHSEARVAVEIDSLNKHFSSPPFSFDVSVKRQTIQEIVTQQPGLHPNFVFEPVFDALVRKIIVSISSRAVGCDGIGRDLLIPILDYILPIITHILNFSLSSGEFPTAWKQAFIVPIPKIQNPSEFSHYRPISILPFLSKVLEKVVQFQLLRFLRSHQLLNQFQSGFRPAHSTCTALIKIMDDIRKGMDSGQLTLLALLDFSNAFNCVDHEILISILKSLNVSNEVLLWFRSYLDGRNQRIKMDDRLSNWHTVSAGVPQGGVLSPLLFSVFINTIARTIEHSQYHLYADDLQLYSTSKVSDLLETIRKMSLDLDSIRLWTERYGLLVNPAKTQIMLVGSSRNLSLIDQHTLPPVTFNSLPLPYCSTVKNLGLHIAHDLSWAPHVAKVGQKVFASFHSLKCLQNFLPVSTKITLVNSLLVPIIDYADVCCTDITEALLDKLERLLNLCIRYIYGIRKYDHVSQYRAELKWLNIRNRRNVHVACMIYKILNCTLSPEYLRERFSFQQFVGRIPRTFYNKFLTTPERRTDYYAYSFTCVAAQLWNSLPVGIREAPSIDVFKSRVSEHFLHKQCE